MRDKIVIAVAGAIYASFTIVIIIQKNYIIQIILIDLIKKNR